MHGGCHGPRDAVGWAVGLREYVRKRRFDRTTEPRGAVARRHLARFVIQKHRASALHYDVRIEADGVLRSWAVPKGPSLDPRDKRLAIRVEDHPVAYGSFEGVIPAGEYGGGTVMLWDQGTYTTEGDPGAAIRAGQLRFTLEGRKLRGGWVLIRTAGRKWLLLKRRDAHASSDVDITAAKPRSVVSRRLLAGIARDAGGDVRQAASGDP